MPKVETFYICNVCGVRYFKEQAAIDCEKTHYEPAKIIDCKYDVNDKKEFPMSINISLKNKNGVSKILTYYRKIGK
jgi:hypothetical protein